MAIPAIVGNLALSIGLSLVSNWLFPKATAKIADDTPQLDTGSPIYFAYGSLAFVPGHLLYALTTTQAGTDDKHSTYAHIGLANPRQTKLIALRINGYILSTQSTWFPLATPAALGLTDSKSKSGKKGKTSGTNTSSDTYTNGYGLKTYTDIDYTVQLETNVYNSHFGLLGYPEIQYEGLTWLKIAGRRNLIGLPASRNVWYVENGDLTDRGTVYAYGQYNDPVALKVNLNYGTNFFITNSVDFNISAQHGVRAMNSIVCFESQTFGSYTRSLVTFGEDNGIIIREDIGNPTITYTVDGTPTAANALANRGDYEQTMLDITEITNPTVNDRVIVAGLNGELQERLLPAPATAPFRSYNGLIYDSFNNLVLTVSYGLKLYGWGISVFREFAESKTGGTNNTTPVAIATKTIALSAIILDLLSLRGIPATQVSFSNWTDTPILGFTCTAENVHDTIVNLCTCYNKFCYKARDGDYVFMDYPVVNDAIATIIPDDFTAEPTSEILDMSSQPQSVELTYRNTAKQLSEDTVTVGNTASQYKNKTRLNVSMSSVEASKVSWNILNLIKNTYLKIELFVDIYFQSLEPGDVIDLFYYPGEPIRLLVANVEYGQDLTVKLSCVNYVSDSSRTQGQIPNWSNLPPVSPSVPPSSIEYINAEMRSPNASLTTGGNLLYTTANAPYRSVGGSPEVSQVRVATVGLYEGTVVDITNNPVDQRYGLTAIKIANGRDGQVCPASGEMRVGNSWISYGARTIGADNSITIGGIQAGLYGSDYKISLGDECHVSGNNPIDPVYPNVFPSVSQGAIAIISDTFDRGHAERSYGLPRLTFSVSSGVLRIWFGRNGARSDFFLRTKTDGAADFNRSLWLSNTANGQSVEIVYTAGQMYHEQILTGLSYQKDDVLELVENKTIGASGYSTPTYGAWVNSCTVR
jgi:hypothetical protein